MRIRKLMYDSFYSNNQAFSGVTSVSALTSDLYFHFFDLNDSKWRLSGNTAALASGVILEDSDTTSIVVTPSGWTCFTGYTQQLAVVNQDGDNVISECTFASSNSGTTISAGGIITIAGIGTSIVTTTHNDGPTGTTAVVAYYPGPVTLSPNPAGDTAVTGVTGTTLQFTLVTNNTGANIASDATWTSVITGTSTASTGVTVSSAGLVTIDNDAEPGLMVDITATYPETGETDPCSTLAPSTPLLVVG